MSRTKKRIANLDPAESYKPQLVTTQWLDNNGVVRTTVHDGNFSPSPQEPALVFIPAKFCDEITGMKESSENPTQYTETNKNYLATAFISKVEQQIDAVDIVLDDDEYQASMISRILINDNTIGSFSQDFQSYLEEYKGTSQIVVAGTELESVLDSGVHTIKVEYNGEESETKAFVVGGNALLPNAVQDYDGNWYDAVIIGDQVWTASNLKTTHYANGNEVLLYSYPNNDETNKSVYGLLYSFSTIMNGASQSNENPSGVQGISPNGWHIPSYAELNELTDFLNSKDKYKYNSEDGKIAKSLAINTGWNTSDVEGDCGNNQSENNIAGLSLAPAGGRLSEDYWYGFGIESENWTTTYLYEGANALALIMCYNSGEAKCMYRTKTYLLSVRCVCDLTTEDFLSWYYNEYGSYNHQIQ